MFISELKSLFSDPKQKQEIRDVSVLRGLNRVVYETDRVDSQPNG